MAHHAMHDHRQAPAWPARPPSVAQRQSDVDRDLEELAIEIDGEEFSAKMAAAHAAVHADALRSLFELTDQELDGLDPDDMTLEIVASGVTASGTWTYRTTVTGERAIEGEKDRRRELTAHQRMTEIRERMRRRAAS